jgi:predicted acylesterase/phospholipase RssA
MLDFDTIVLSSGGTKGYAIIGALSRFTLGNYIVNVKHWVGVSIGSIISLLYICGYEVMEINNLDVEVFINLWMTDFKLTELPQGLIRIQTIREFLSNLIENKIHMKDPTFSQLFEITNKKLTVVSCIVRAHSSSVCYHNVETKPNSSVIDAVIGSCCIPLMIEKHIIDGNIHVDGGLASPFPIEYVDNGSNKVLGIYVESINDINTKVGYLSASFDVMKHVDLERQKAKMTNNVMLIEIMCKDINPLEYKQQKENLFVQGWKLANSLLE